MIAMPKSIGGYNDFKIMVDQLSEERACSILDIHRTTLRRLLKPDAKVPRAYVVALYWETKWGRGQIDSDHLFELQLLHNKINWLKKENARLVDAMARMEGLLDFGSANSPVLNLQKVR
jgi:hypothetical protein